MEFAKYNMEQAVKITAIGFSLASNFYYIKERSKTWRHSYRAAGWVFITRPNEILTNERLETYGLVFIDGKPYCKPKVTITFADGSKYERKFEDYATAKRFVFSIRQDVNSCSSKWLDV